MNRPTILCSACGKRIRYLPGAVKLTGRRAGWYHVGCTPSLSERKDTRQASEARENPSNVTVSTDRYMVTGFNPKPQAEQAKSEKTLYFCYCIQAWIRDGIIEPCGHIETGEDFERQCTACTKAGEAHHCDHCLNLQHGPTMHDNDEIPSDYPQDYNSAIQDLMDPW